MREVVTTKKVEKVIIVEEEVRQTIITITDFFMWLDENGCYEKFMANVTSSKNFILFCKPMAESPQTLISSAFIWDTKELTYWNHIDTEWRKYCRQYNVTAMEL